MNPSDPQISAIKVFKHFEQAIAKINIFPLSKDNLNIQQDAYKRLATNETDEAFETFAGLEQSKKERDTDQRFAIEFGNDGFILAIEGVGDLYVAYDDIDTTEAKIARQIVIALTMLANGQLCNLTTLRRGKVCASELVYKEKADAKPITIGVDGKYPRFIRSDSPDDYEVHVLRNQFALQPVRMPDHFFMRALRADGSPLVIPREFESNALTPLTKAHHATVINEIGNKLLGAEDDKDLSRKVYSSWVFWLFFITVAAACFGYLPDNLVDGAAPVIGIGSAFVAAYITGRYFAYLEKVRLVRPDHPLIKVDQLLSFQNVLPVLLALCLGVILFSLSFPIFVTKSGHQLVSYWQLPQVISPFVWLPVSCLAMALILSLIPKIVTRITAAGLAIAGVVGVLIVNFGFTYAGDAVKVPEPQTTIAIASYLIGIVLAVTLIVTYVRAKKLTTSI
ncbi:MAG: hypothetical protein JWM37_110 [Candidatus Saccharibacteria bacterium]|nr:hypothetical protein [Candidatus Saccharibacteria bacterium]